MKRRKATTGSEHPNTARVMHQLAHAYGRTAGRKSEVLPFVRDGAENKSRSAWRGSSARRSRTCGALAVAYNNANRYSDAETLRRKILAANLRKNANDTVSVTVAQMDLGQNLMLAGKIRRSRSAISHGVRGSRKSHARRLAHVQRTGSGGRCAGRAEAGDISKCCGRRAEKENHGASLCSFLSDAVDEADATD